VIEQDTPPYTAWMTQPKQPPPYTDLLEALQLEMDPIVAEIVRDVAGPGDDLEELAVSVRAAAESTIVDLTGRKS